MSEQQSDKDHAGDGDGWELPNYAPSTTTGQFSATLAGWANKGDVLTITLTLSGAEARLVAANLPRLTGLLTVVLTAEAAQLEFWAS